MQQNVYKPTVFYKQQRFYNPLIQDNPGEPVPETIRHINPRYHHYPPQYLSFALAILIIIIIKHI